MNKQHLLGAHSGDMTVHLMPPHSPPPSLHPSRLGLYPWMCACRMSSSARSPACSQQLSQPQRVYTVSGIYAVERADVSRWESSLSFLFLSLFFFPSPSFSHFLCLFPPLVFPRRPPLAPALCARSPHHTGQGPRQGGWGRYRGPRGCRGRRPRAPAPPPRSSRAPPARARTPAAAEK